VKIEDCGIILLLLVTVGQIVAQFMFARIPIQQNINTLPAGTYVTTAVTTAIAVEAIVSAVGKNWHNVETWTITARAVATTASSSDYLVCMKEGPDNNRTNEKEVKRLNARLRRWRCKMRKTLSRIKASFLSRYHISTRERKGEHRGFHSYIRT